MNNKILSLVLLAGIATTGFAGISSASSNGTRMIFGNKTEMREFFDKVQSGEILTAKEQAFLDTAKKNIGERGLKKGFDGFGKRAGFNNLTQGEITELEVMTDIEKNNFFKIKKAEMKAEKETRKGIIDALIAGETLSANQEAIRLEMLATFKFDTQGTHTRKRSDIIGKIIAGDTLSLNEENDLTVMQLRQKQR